MGLTFRIVWSWALFLSSKGPYWTKSKWWSNSQPCKSKNHVLFQNVWKWSDCLVSQLFSCLIPNCTLICLLYCFLQSFITFSTRSMSQGDFCFHHTSLSNESLWTRILGVYRILKSILLHVNLFFYVIFALWFHNSHKTGNRSFNIWTLN